MLINNAGILTYGNFQDAPVERLYSLIQTNVTAPMHLTALFLPDMLQPWPRAYSLHVIRVGIRADVIRKLLIQHLNPQYGDLAWG